MHYFKQIYLVFFREVTGDKTEQSEPKVACEHRSTQWTGLSPGGFCPTHTNVVTKRSGRNVNEGVILFFY